MLQPGDRWCGHQHRKQAHLATLLLVGCASPYGRLARAQSETTPPVKASPPISFPEGTFEDVAPDGNPTGWVLSDRKHMQVMREGNNHFLRLTNENATGTVLVESHFRLKPSWKSIKVAAHLRTTHLQPGQHVWECARLGFVFERAPGERIGDYPDSPKLRQDSDWVLKNVIVPVPEGARFVNLQPILQNATGALDLDDIQLIGNPPLTTKTLRPGFPEGDFEQLDPNGNPLGWSIDDPHIHVVTEAGNHFLRLTNDDPQLSVFMDNYFKIDPAWRAIQVSARLRGHDLHPGTEPYYNARFGYAFAGENGQRVGDWPQAASLLQDTNGWRVFHITIIVPRGAAYIKMTPILHNTTGTLDIDDINFEPAGEP